MKARLLIACVTVFAACFLAPRASAQSDFPNKQIKILIGFPAGGSTDALARVLSSESRRALGQEMLVVNKGGAAGTLALNELIASPPDGYTIAITPSSVTTTAHRFQGIRPDFLEQTSGLLMAGRQRVGMMASIKSPIRTFKEFIAEARANPGKLSLGIIGLGTSGAIIFRATLQQEKLDVNLVPLNGDAPVATAVLGGHVTAGIGSSASFSEHVRAGTMRLLASGERERLAIAADVPNLVELGYPYKSNSIQYVLAPKGLPPAVSQKLIAIFAAAMKTPTYVDIAKKNELYDPTVIQGNDLDKYLLADRGEVGALIEKLGLEKK